MKKTLFVYLIFVSAYVNAQSLNQNIKSVLAEFENNTGVAVLDNSGKLIADINAQDKYVLQSVFKFHLALAILNKVDNGELKLSQKITLQAQDFIKDAYSPMALKDPEGKNPVSLGDLIVFSAGQSDNVACEALFRLLGGPEVLNRFLKEKNVEGVSIKHTERGMFEKSNAQFDNWSTAVSAVQLLHKFENNEIISKASTDFLRQILVSSPTGPKRLKGLLPSSTLVAHKTGTSGTKDGITTAVNDIGIVYLPNGSHYYIAVFVSDSPYENPKSEEIIARVSKTVFDYMLKTK